MRKIEVLDKGFVTLIDFMGSDLSAVNAARISFNKQKDVMDADDEKLIKYLVDHEHMSPFRHQYITFHVKAPIFVFRQWMKHRIASEFNEVSGRYVNLGEVDFYVPDIFRGQHVQNKQGSEGIVNDNNHAQLLFSVACENSLKEYNKLIELGVCREQARCVLPLGIYSEVFWTVSLQAAAPFIRLRKDGHAQKEIQDYAFAVEQLLTDIYPVSLRYLADKA